MACPQAGARRGLPKSGMHSSSSSPQIHHSEFYWIVSNFRVGEESGDEVEGGICLQAFQRRQGV